MSSLQSLYVHMPAQCQRSESVSVTFPAKPDNHGAGTSSHGPRGANTQGRSYLSLFARAQDHCMLRVPLGLGRVWLSAAPRPPGPPAFQVPSWKGVRSLTLTGGESPPSTPFLPEYLVLRILKKTAPLSTTA